VGTILVGLPYPAKVQPDSQNLFWAGGNGTQRDERRRTESGVKNGEWERYSARVAALREEINRDFIRVNYIVYNFMVRLFSFYYDHGAGWRYYTHIVYVAIDDASDDVYGRTSLDNGDVVSSRMTSFILQRHRGKCEKFLKLHDRKKMLALFMFPIAISHLSLSFLLF